MTDVSKPDTIVLNRAGSRMEYVQQVRENTIDRITKIEGWEKDESLSITMTQLLNGLEKQELAKLKMAQEKDEGDKDRAIAQRAISLMREMRRRRDDHQVGEIDNQVSIPEVDLKQLPAEGDKIAQSERSFQESNFSEFEMNCIKQGLDPSRRWDEATQQVITVKQE